MKLIYHLVNVFTRDDDPLSGNPLCVFEDAGDLPVETMQALARQFNLSETTFLSPSAHASGRVRIFTPAEELPFAGHPTLGSAHIVRMRGGGNSVSLEMLAGIIPVEADGNLWTLTANPPTHREPSTTQKRIAAALGLDAVDIGERPLWVSTGTEQLLIPLHSAAAVVKSSPVAALLDEIRSAQGRSMACLFHDAGDGTMIMRFFFKIGDTYGEDPGTGSACANLGGWCLAMGRAPVQRTVYQGDQVSRPSTLHLAVGDDKRIRVSGAVAYLGRGELEIGAR